MIVVVVVFLDSLSVFALPGSSIPVGKVGQDIDVVPAGEDDDDVDDFDFDVDFIMSYNMISYDIKSYDKISYDMISYHMT